eukprot:6091428-Karenia_brevis.AAC.1
MPPKKKAKKKESGESVLGHGTGASSSDAAGGGPLQPDSACLEPQPAVPTESVNSKLDLADQQALEAASGLLFDDSATALSSFLDDIDVRPSGPLVSPPLSASSREKKDRAPSHGNTARLLDVTRQHRSVLMKKWYQQTE